MRTRLIVTGSAIALAAIILLLAIHMGTLPFTAQSHNQQQAEQEVQPITPPERAVVDPPLDGFRVEGPYEIRRKTTSGRILVLQANSSEPLPDGEVKVQAFKAQIYTPNESLIDIRADHGQVYAPDQKPRRGTLKGNVLIRFFTKTNVDLLNPTSPHELVRCLLDEVSFEREMGRIDSESPVVIHMRRAEIRGHGLHLIHSELDNQIKKLTGLRRGAMRLVPDIGPSGLVAIPGSSQTDTNQSPYPKAKTTKPIPKGERPPPQWYLATFHENVTIHNNFAGIHADQLQVVFDLGASVVRDYLMSQMMRGASPNQGDRYYLDVSHKMASQSQERVRSDAIALGSVALLQGPGDFRHNVFAHVMSALLASVGDTSTSLGALTLEHEDQTTIAWRGQMTIVPLQPDAPESAGLEGPGDMLVMLRGKPVRITTQDNHTIRAATVDYFMSTGRLRLTASSPHPLIDSPAVGVEIRAPKLVLDQSRCMGVFTGPGSVRAHDDPGLIAATEPEGTLDGRLGRLPAGTVIHWDEALDLSFYKQEASSHSTADPIQIAALRDAVFRGNVMLRHPAVDLDADRLSVNLNNPSDGRQIAHRVLAVGNVMVAAEGGTEQKPIRVQSDWLTMHMKQGAHGGIWPTRIEARGDQTNVVAVHEDMKLSAGKLYVSLSMPSSSEASQLRHTHANAPRRNVDSVSPLPFDTDNTRTEPAHEPTPNYLLPSANMVGSPQGVMGSQINVVAELLIAEQDVRIQVTSKDELITADRAVVNVPAKRLELYGTDRQMAQWKQPAGMFEGQYIVMVEETKTARAVGPGRAMFFETPRPVLAATVSHHAPASATLAVTWNDSMQFDHIRGLAQFVGRVKVASTLAKDTFNLSADDLRVQFIETGPTRGSPVSNGQPNYATETSITQLNASQRFIKSLDARGNMTFLAESWVDRPGGNLATSVAIQGPSLNFLDITEQVEVPGPGSMVFVDQRPKQDKPRASSDLADYFVAFAGRGNTLFEWSGSLTLDANRNDMLIRDQVKMTHLVSTSDEALIMDCQRLLADLAATGGLKMWFGDNVPKPTIEFVQADGSVRVIRGGLRIATDHLKYTGSNEMIRLDADEGWTTQVSSPGSPTISARSILWYLRTSRFRATDLGPVHLGR